MGTRSRVPGAVRPEEPLPPCSKHWHPSERSVERHYRHRSLQDRSKLYSHKLRIVAVPKNVFGCGNSTESRPTDIGQTFRICCTLVCAQFGPKTKCRVLRS